MPSSKKKIRVAILGCGAIGSRIAQSIFKELKGICELSGFYDCAGEKSALLAKALAKPKLRKNSLKDLLGKCDLMVEAVNAQDTRQLIRAALQAGKSVLAMSTGKLLNAQDLFKLAARNRCSLLIPSGAIAGIDALKSASLANIDRIILTTRKPLSGFLLSPARKGSGVDLSAIQGETVLFEGDVDRAVKLFPQNINVAATLALAGRAKKKITIRIITSPEYKRNSHEVEVLGDFGRIWTRTENTVCPDNPKTSYLAVLSAIQTLKDFCLGVKIGT